MMMIERMTRPTQTQIEAHRKAYWDAWEKTDSNDAALIAALTAAAEVEKPSARLQQMIAGTRRNDTAAAEVGEQEWQRGYDAGMEAQRPTIETLKGTTIERCALVAHDWLKHHGYEIEAIECAAAIRALKDQP